MKTTEIPVDLGDRSYPIFAGQDILGMLPAQVARLQIKGTIGIVTDANTGPLYGDRVRALLEQAGYKTAIHTMPAGEEQKRLARVEEICGTFLEARLDRSSLIVALGGGVVGDIAGFAASAYMRGIPFIQIPTTIVAQVDSSVGGKTGVNHPLGKNTIGAFHQPGAVLIDMTLLRTLPDRELRAGMAEVIKHGIIADAALFEHTRTHATAILAKDLDALLFPVVRSCEIKSAIVMADEKEMGVRANLNYGHTFGHAIESVTRYETYLHGEAIALGMVAAGAMSESLGMVAAGFNDAQKSVFAAYGLPVRWPELPVEACLEAMKKDKKVRAGAMKFILATGIGQVAQRTDIDEDCARAALSSLK
ncbi:MAG: 3-dehydroquinate synthase [Candidatus Hydrogenedentes bacterium]|nr:3-dehydroquinate synthase [Candidatus Hydrogenedentota bacterium]